MSRKFKKYMSDTQLKQAVDELNAKPKITLRGGRGTNVIPDKRKEQSKKACRGKANCDD